MRRLLSLLLLLSLGCPGPAGEPKQVRIPAGLTTSAIADTLQARGIIDNPTWFRVLARVLGYDRKLRHGRYELRENSGELRVLRALTVPGRTSVMVTIPEGFRLTRIAALLEEQGVCPEPEFLESCGDRSLLAELSIPGPNAEGYLFPDTYDFELESAPEDVIRRMVARFRAVWEQLVAEVPSPPLGPKATVILASVVEKEAAMADEVPTIAGVFVNRLEKGMPLQSCATVQYVLPEHRECLTYRDTRIESPYNTYLHPGLPPGPISNPGRRALRAALAPAETDYLYFVARGDGSHVFSRTWREHEKAKRRVNSGA